MSILIKNQQRRMEISPEKVRQTAQTALNVLEMPEGELSVLIVDDPGIAEYNRQYLNREGPTNVIAFPMLEGEYSEINAFLLGDVVISVETALKEAENAEMRFEDRFDELLIHGILHLFGYDHENDEDEAVRMEAKSRELLARVRGGAVS